MKRKLIIALALCLALALGIGGTMAYLTATTGPVVNTFTIGNVGLELKETKGTLDANGNHQFKMVPGNTIDKDPTVTVTAGSEDCWLFVKLVKSANFDNYLTYAVDTSEGAWTALDGHPGVYYREVKQADTVKSFSVLKGDQVTVKENVANFQATTQTPEFVQPTLTISAAAIQQANIANVQTAYNNLPAAFKG